MFIGISVFNPGQVIPKTQKIVIGEAMVDIQHNKVGIKGKVEQSLEWSRALPYTAMQ